MNKDQEVVAALLSIQELHNDLNPDRKVFLRDQVKRLYCRILGRYSGPQLSAAANRWLAAPDSGKRFPAPADLVAIIEARDEDSTRALEDEGRNVWAMIGRTIGNEEAMAGWPKTAGKIVSSMGGTRYLGELPPRVFAQRENEFVRQWCRRLRGYKKLLIAGGTKEGELAGGADVPQLPFTSGG
jgi:hypothetical protein